MTETETDSLCSCCVFVATQDERDPLFPGEHSKSEAEENGHRDLPCEMDLGSALSGVVDTAVIADGASLTDMSYR